MTHHPLAAECEANIEAMAAKDFAAHVLTRRPDGSWRCGVPDTNHFAFYLFTAPGTCCVWGDLGEFVLRHGDTDGLRWWLTAGSRDYFLGKVAAAPGPRWEFLYGEAIAHLAWLDHEIVQAGDASSEDDKSVARRQIAAVREAMEEVEHENAVNQHRAWWDAWSEAGDSDPATCTGWTSGPLWLWEMARCFRRLYAEQTRREAVVEILVAGLPMECDP